MRPHRCALVAVMLVVGLVTAGCGGDDEPRVGGTTLDGVLESEERLVALLETSETVIGQPLRWPEGPATVTASVLTMQPGEGTGPHYHEAPMFALVLEGEVTVDYGADGSRTYTEGTAIMEAQAVVHNGTNTGDVPVKLLVVNVGADGVENSVAVEE